MNKELKTGEGYISPEIIQYELHTEAVLCASGDNESYYGIPGDDETIF